MIELIDYERCNRCGVCMDVCPTDVFRRREAGGDFYIGYLDDCQACFNCELECPKDAIRVAPARKHRIQSL